MEEKNKEAENMLTEEVEEELVTEEDEDKRGT